MITLESIRELIGLPFVFSVIPFEGEALTAHCFVAYFLGGICLGAGAFGALIFAPEATKSTASVCQKLDAFIACIFCLVGLLLLLFGLYLPLATLATMFLVAVVLATIGSFYTGRRLFKKIH